ncbi:fungal-specific transcription factor domain-domain-containing protein [Naematelia encephala]|uniref:Fungal-specific transcription factor domain-domain-containing protein n=1 Tax=Naematelia encephala TaxID=71784 RepID=A0A1Y2BKX8_9TREE|nr:fungal-specific transcription factor domain-domain-containing protein [Naematelia encephala]
MTGSSGSTPPPSSSSSFLRQASVPHPHFATTTTTAPTTTTSTPVNWSTTLLPSIRSLYPFQPTATTTDADGNNNNNDQTSVLPPFSPNSFSHPSASIPNYAPSSFSPLDNNFHMHHHYSAPNFTRPVPSQTRPITAPASLPSHSGFLRSTPAFTSGLPIQHPTQEQQQSQNPSYVQYHPQYLRVIQRSSMSPPERNITSRAPRQRDPTGRSGRKKSACERCRRRRQNLAQCSRGLPCDRCMNDGVAGECSYAAVEQQQHQMEVAMMERDRDRDRRPSRSSPRGPRESRRFHQESNQSPASGATSSYAIKTESMDDGDTEYRDTEYREASFPMERDTNTNSHPQLPLKAVYTVHSQQYLPRSSLSANQYTQSHPNAPSSKTNRDGHHHQQQSEGGGFGRMSICWRNMAVRVLAVGDLFALRGAIITWITSVCFVFSIFLEWSLTTTELFFGTSHFGPQLAATVIEGRKRSPVIAVSDVRQGPAHGMSSADDTKPYTLSLQLRELFPFLPTRKEQCDRYVRCFFERYNAHIDLLYRPDYDLAYNKLWTPEGTLKPMGEVDPRQLGLVFIVLAFGVLLEYDPQIISQRREFVTSLPVADGAKAELHEMVDELETKGESLAGREERSKIWEWAAQRALNEPSKFFGESVDTVRAWALIALYMVISRRVPEAWTAVGQAVRNAQALGMHVDGSYWDRMTFVEVELNRRLWAQLYTLDRSVSLFLGRPLAIQDGQMNCKPPSNLTDDELDQARPDRPLDHPTKTTFLILHQRLADIIGNVQLECFGLQPRKYEDVLKHEAVFQSFKESLPPHFRLDGDADTSLDGLQAFGWLIPQRQSLISKFHLARISLHRPYLLRSLSDPRYAASREACLQSAIADIQLRTITMVAADPLERFKWMTVASGFNPATIIGILCVWSFRDHRYDFDTLMPLLQDYVAAERLNQRRDEQLENELRVLDMMVEKAIVNRERERRLARDHPLPILTHSSQSSGPTPPTGFRHDTDATLYSNNNIYTHPLQSPLDGLMGLPALSDPTGSGMPDSGDLGAWALVVSDPLFSVGGAGGDTWYGNEGFGAPTGPWAETAWVG